MKRKSKTRHIVEMLEKKVMRRHQVVWELWNLSNKDANNFSNSHWSTNITKLFYSGVLRRHKDIGYWCNPGTSSKKTFYDQTSGYYAKYKENVIYPEDLYHPDVKAFVEKNPDKFI